MHRSDASSLPDAERGPLRNDATAECPRCGYDMGGEVARWAEACPLESTCPECGYAVAWRLVFGPALGVPRWSVEHPRRGLIGGALRTFFRTLRPGRFWATLELTSHARPFRLVGYALLGFVLVTLIAGGIELGLLAWLGLLQTQMYGYWQTPRWVELTQQVASPLVAPFGLFEWKPWGAWGGWLPELMREYLMAPLFVALCPLVYLVLPVTLRRCRVRKTHIARAFLLGLPAAAFVCEMLFLSHLLIRSHSRLGPAWAWLGLVYGTARSGLIWLVVLLIWQGVWWHAVNRRYLRLPNPLGVTGAVIAIAGLGTLIPLLAFTGLGPALVRFLGLA